MLTLRFAPHPADRSPAVGQPFLYSGVLWTRRISAIAFASIIALVGCASPQAGASAPPPGASTPPPSATFGEAPFATQKAARIPAISWSEHSFDGQVHALAVDGAQLVAVGATANGLAAWTSPDGGAWEEHAVPQSRTLSEWRENPERPDDGSEGMGALARLGDTLFSFGTFFAYDGDVLRPVGWRSADATEWESIESNSVFFAQGGAVVDLVAGDPGLLALTRGPVHQYGGGIWLWTAETSWVQTTPLDVAWESETGGAVVWDAVWAQGKFVAVGLAATYEPARTWASSWVSTDGRSWQAAPPYDDREEAVMYAVSPVTGGGFVAVGCERCPEGQLGTPAAWISPDGLAWTAVALPADFEGAANGVVQLGSGFLAIGGAPVGTATWTSADGVNWQAGPIPEGGASTHNIAVWQDEVVLFLYGDPVGVPHDSVLLRGRVQP